MSSAPTAWRRRLLPLLSLLVCACATAPGAEGGGLDDPSASAPSTCALEPNFAYATYALPPVRHARAEPPLTFGKQCGEHRLKIRPDCTWSAELSIDVICPCGYLQGLSVRYARFDRGDRDYHDVKLSCGDEKGSAWGGPSFLSFASAGASANRTATAACPVGKGVVGVKVTHTRRSWSDRDLYDFEVRCEGGGVYALRLHERSGAGGGRGADDAPPATLRERWREWWLRQSRQRGTRRWWWGAGAAAELGCGGSGEAGGTAARMRGLRVSRAFQEDGDIDQYEFGALC